MNQYQFHRQKKDDYWRAAYMFKRRNRQKYLQLLKKGNQHSILARGWKRLNQQLA